MGYLTTYDLTACRVKNEEQGEQIHRKLKELGVINYALHYDGTYGDVSYFFSCDVVKWYEHDEDMLKVSEEFPEVLFELFGDGESGDDIWKTYYLGGKMQYCPGEIVFPEFDEAKLE